MLHIGLVYNRALLYIVLICFLTLCKGVYASGEEVSPPVSEQIPAEQADEAKYVSLEFEPDAYYTNLGLYLALTKTPIPHVGEQTEKNLYLTLLSRAYAPRFLVIEGSVNPLPYLGTYIRDRHQTFYDNAELYESFNWIKAVTAGFEEPFAFSIFLGNVVDFSIPEDRESKGKGYSGMLYSRGTYHIKDNMLIRDDWWEIEWKVKGDRRTQDRKMSWSFRIGAKMHGNHEITDIYYFSFRRSRLDYRPTSASIFNNSGFEYTVDLDRKTSTPIRHYFLIDKKWPFSNRKMAFSLATGFIWESSGKYSGSLSSDRRNSDLQIILRPNLEF